MERLSTGNFDGEDSGSESVDFDELSFDSPKVKAKKKTVDPPDDTVFGWVFERSLIEQIRIELTFDMYQRKVRCWELVKIEGVLSCKGKDPFTTFRAIRQYKGLFDTFEFVKPLMAEFGDKIVAAGGAIANHILLQSDTPVTTTNNLDVDFFFYGISEAQASQTLEDIVAFLCTRVKTVGYQPGPNPGETVCTQIRIEKGLKYVNVRFCYEQHKDGMYHGFQRIYQFVLRIYPTMASVIGGFDIPLSAFLWDGRNFYGTRMAVFCAQNQICIANLAAESPSFQHRLVKYCTRFGCRLFYPGLKRSFYRIDDKPNIETVKEDVKKAFEKNGFRIHPWHAYGQSSAEWLDSLGEIARLSNVGSLHRILFCENGVVEMKRSLDPGLAKMSKEAVARVTDYSCTMVGNGGIRSMNTSVCGAGNPDATVICHVYSDVDVDQDGVRKDFQLMINKPKLTVLTVEELRRRFKYHCGRVYTQYEYAEHRIKYTGKPNGPYNGKEFREFVKTHTESAKLAVEMHKGVHWMVNNPGRQWTASWQPMFTSAKEYYGEFYKRFEVGIPWKVLRLLYLGYRRNSGSFLSVCPSDVFRLILLSTLYAYGQSDTLQ